jgi:RNA polymerase-binding transcription factor DksA
LIDPPVSHAEVRLGLRIDCGSPIDRVRLAATPCAARCVECHVQYERHASGALR